MDSSMDARAQIARACAALRTEDMERAWKAGFDLGAARAEAIATLASRLRLTCVDDAPTVAQLMVDEGVSEEQAIVALLGERGELTEAAADAIYEGA